MAVGAAAKYTLRPVQHLSTHYEGECGVWVAHSFLTRLTQVTLVMRRFW